MISSLKIHYVVPETSFIHVWRISYQIYFFTFFCVKILRSIFEGIFHKPFYSLCFENFHLITYLDTIDKNCFIFQVGAPSHFIKRFARFFKSSWGLFFFPLKISYFINDWQVSNKVLLHFLAFRINQHRFCELKNNFLNLWY